MRERRVEHGTVDPQPGLQRVVRQAEKEVQVARDRIGRARRLEVRYMTKEHRAPPPVRRALIALVAGAIGSGIRQRRPVASRALTNHYCAARQVRGVYMLETNKRMQTTTCAMLKKP